MEKSFSKVALAILFLSIFALAAMTTPAARAQTISVNLSPSSGPPGTLVIVYVSNYPAQDTTFSLTFGSTTEQSIYGAYEANSASGPLYVPTVQTGKYTVTVTDQNGVSGTATFTVTQTPEIVVTPGPTGTSTGTSGTGTSSTAPSGPTYYPVTPYGGVPTKSGFWSPLAIGIVAFVVAVACFTTVVFVRRGRQGPARLEDDSSYKPGSPAGSTQPTSYKPTAQETSPYGYKPSAQPTSPYSYRSRYSAQETSPYSSRYSTPQTRYNATPQYNQTATSRLQPPAHTKVCKHCKRDVREDLNVCPYCFKKLK
jgi:hypothetical protein